MAEGGVRIGGFGSGLAVILTEDDNQKAHLISSCDDIGRQPIEQTLEYIFDLPHKSIHPLSSTSVTVDAHASSILMKVVKKYRDFDRASRNNRDGISIIDIGYGPHTIAINEASICGDIRVIKQPLLLESAATFSSARANACAHEGKWMYEVILETAGVQQLGWAAVYCQFTDRRGVGDAEDSYSFDGSRVTKWNKEPEAYGQSWVVGDVIGCCIDLDDDGISFYRNGVSLGLAFDKIRKMGPGLGYYPAISLSQGERCSLNFGALPFKYPIEGFLSLQSPPSVNSLATHLLKCLSRLLELQYLENFKSTSVERMRRLKRFQPLEVYYPISCMICQEFFSAVNKELGSSEYIMWGPFTLFLMEVFGKQAPHDYVSLDRVMDLFLEFRGSRLMFQHVINALSCSCKTASLVLMDCPYSGSYAYLSLACHILKREELMTLWWRSLDFEFSLEGFLSRKGPNKQDLQCLMPSVWWSGSCEGGSRESSMMLTNTALSGAIEKIEEMHRELCLLVIQFIPPITPLQLPGSVFRKFLENLLLKNRGADRSPPTGASSNSVLASLYTVILHFLSEGFAMEDICGWMKVSASGKKVGVGAGFLHRSGEKNFPVSLFFKDDPHRTDISRLGGSFNHLTKSQPVVDERAEVIRWEEGFMDNEESRVTHSTKQKPCCCSSSGIGFSGTPKDSVEYTAKGSRIRCNPIPERSSNAAIECSTGSFDEEVMDKPSSSNQSNSEYDYWHVQYMRTVATESYLTASLTLREEELLDSMLMLYHLGLAPNFKQASYYMSRQSQSISLLEETDKQIRERSCSEQLKRLKEARSLYREEVIDYMRQCAWYRISLFSCWKQRGMYATCMWLVQMLLVLSRVDSVFVYIPEFYLETLVDCFHALRKSDPPFVPSAAFIKQGLSSFVTFIVTHFNDPRICSADLRDLLLQSISVLVQCKDYMVAFESNQAAIQRMPKALLSAFDNRSWIPVTNILIRLCKGSGFGLSKHEEPSLSLLFQSLLRQACIHDEGLFSAFLNSLFNTLSWIMTEFSVSVREMQEKYQVMELHQKKCSVMFDLSCNLARVLEFFSYEIPQAFLSGSEMNLRRLTEMIVFILNHITSAADIEFFDLTTSLDVDQMGLPICSINGCDQQCMATVGICRRYHLRLLRRQGQSSEKTNRGMILAPLVGIILNLLDASTDLEHVDNDVVGVFSSMECPATINYGFQYLLEYNWAGFLRVGDTSLERLRQLEKFSSLIRSRTETAKVSEIVYSGGRAAEEEDEGQCCICYACEADAQFKPCSHKSCFGCITRHLLNSQRCFFCNGKVVEVFRVHGKKL
ncbi:hypothetical protein GIB67_026162 [Kingdonia uniflora]|uniref:B30.2/SPRY domain-containing protein n=1 Tax=Kingdonia uniflora TaxID=39325 RepID=A0A7J7M387_9MAGN|nr:hypothetical protein GIB67_026162 [Kingdonia uniflora]